MNNILQNSKISTLILRVLIILFGCRFFSRLERIRAKRSPCRTFCSQALCVRDLISDFTDVELDDPCDPLDVGLQRFDELPVVRVG